jgi:hypothetical protein
MCRATSRRSLLEAGFLFVTFTSLRFKCIAGEENCKKTSISYSMVSLDQLPDTWGYDMEWAFSVYWANDVYKVGFGDKTLVKFFPQSFYDAFHIPFRLAEGMAYHFVFMWLFFLNGILYVFYTILFRRVEIFTAQQAIVERSLAGVAA